MRASLQFLVQFLQGQHFADTAVVQRVQQCTRAGHGSGVRDAMLQGLAPDRERVGNRLASLGGVDDVADLAILDEVDDVRTTFDHLVDPFAGDAIVKLGAAQMQERRVLVSAQKAVADGQHPWVRRVFTADFSNRSLGEGKIIAPVTDHRHRVFPIQ